MKRHRTTHPPRWLAVLAGLLVWTSADGERHCRRPAKPVPPPPPIARPADKPPARAPAADFLCVR